MSTSFLTNSVVAIAGSFLVVASQVFSSGTTGWLAFAIGVGALVIAGVAQADRSRAVAQRALDGVVAVLSGWTIVASLVFHNAPLTWLSFAEALGLVGLAYAGLIYDEVRQHTKQQSAGGANTSESLRAAA